MHLTPGQNTGLSHEMLSFSASSATAFDVSALVVDASLRALSSDDFVFYNQPHTRGVHLVAGGIQIDLDAVRSDASAVLCIVSVDPNGAATAFTRLTATLHDRAGVPVVDVDISCGSGESAVICWELYRRDGGWKVRAVGQGYVDGLSGLISRHGVDVEDGEDRGAPPDPQGDPAETYGPIDPLDPNHVLERFEMILEDGARSAAAYVTARQFAESRLDDEMTAAVADPASRNTPDSALARDRAQQRHDTVVEQARTRHDRDSAHLAAELRIIGPALPRPFADWDSPVWTSPPADRATADGIRLGALSAPDRGPLRIPLCLPFPLRQPVHIVGPDTPGTAGVVFAVALRVLAADPHGRLDVIDLSGGLQSLTGGLAGRAHGTTVTRVEDVAAYLESVSRALELAILDRSEGTGEAMDPPRLLILNHFPYGYEQRHWPALAFLAEYGPSMGISLVIVGDESGPTDPIGDHLARLSYPLPAEDVTEWRDPWTRTAWRFTADRVPADAARLARVVAAIALG